MTVSVRWRPSGGRGEFEFVPAHSLEERDISVDFGALNILMKAEVLGRHLQGKPRLRKHERNNRSKLHLPQLVMAVSGLPEPAREDKGDDIQFPLENGQFVMDSMDFKIIEDDGMSVVLAPLRVSILRSDTEINLQDRLRGISEDWKQVDQIREHGGKLAACILAHKKQVEQGVNSRSIRRAADNLIGEKTNLFGHTNAGSASSLIEAGSRPEVDIEAIAGREGRLLARLHVYRERDKAFSKRVRDYYLSKGNGKIECNACREFPVNIYGPLGHSAIEVHHKIPIEELQPDTVTTLAEMAVLCANCHRVVHSKRPCLSVEDVGGLVASQRTQGGMSL